MLRVEGSDATLLRWKQGELLFRTARSAPPGARLVAHVGDGVSVSFRVKVHRCRAVDAGAFEISGGAIDLRKEARAALDALAAAGTGDGKTEP